MHTFLGRTLLLSFLLCVSRAQAVTASPGYELWTVGDNNYGQLGNGVTFVPTLVQIAEDSKAVSASKGSIFVIKNDGSLWAAGKVTLGSLGSRARVDRSSLLKLATNVKAVSSRGQLTQILKNDGTLTFVSDDYMVSENSPLSGFDSDVVQASQGFDFGAYIKSDGSLWVYGYSSSQVVADNSGAVASSNPRQIAVGIKAVSAGGFHLAYIDANDDLWTVGQNPYGALGTGNLVSSLTPTKVMGLVKSVHAGIYSTLIIKQDGSLWYSGLNSMHVAGAPSTEDSIATPVKIHEGVVDAFDAQNGLLYRTQNGDVFARGWIADGGLGVGGQHDVITDTRIFSNASGFALGEGNVLILDSLGRVFAAGGNEYGQVPGAPITIELLPIKAASSVTSASAGRSHTAFISADGKLWAMGINAEGQLGDGSRTTRPLPVEIASDVIQVEAAASHTVFLKSDGSAWVTGTPYFNDPSTGKLLDTAVPVKIADDIQSVSARGFSTFLIRKDHTVWAAGANSSGQIGQSFEPEQHTFVQVASDVVSVHSAILNTVFIHSDGRVTALGDNSATQIKFGGDPQYLVPFEIGNDVIQASASLFDLLLLKSDGSLWANGGNYGDQLGSPDIFTYDFLKIGENVVDCGASITVTAFVKSDGSLWTMGGSTMGMLGNGTFLSLNKPGKIDENVVSVSIGETHMVYLKAATASPFILKSQPLPRTITEGDSATFSVLALQPGEATFQWQKSSDDGRTWEDIAAANQSTLSVSTTDTSLSGMQFRCKISSAEQTQFSDGAGLNVLAKQQSGRPINLSVRGPAGQGDQTLIGGFVISGTGSKKVVIRVSGPALGAFGLTNVVADPQLKLYSGATLVAQNDDWDPSLATDFSSVGAFEWPANSHDAALVITLAPGSYTVHAVNPVAGSTPEALIEVYDESRDPNSTLSNLSCRVVEAVSSPLIVGSVLDGPASLVVRNGGPSLHQFGLTEAADDTRLKVYDGKIMTAENDDWSPALAALFGRLGAYDYGYASKDAALFLPKAPQAITVHATAVNAEGVGIVELYLLR